MWNSKPGGFGASTNTFGASSLTTPGGFGSKPTTGGFGSSLVSPPASSGFGAVTSTPFQANRGGFGSPSTSTFGSTNTGFGNTGGGLGGFGATAQSSNPFGAPAQTNTGFGGSAFGSSGTSNVTSPFGGGSTFGATSTGFGATTNAFGSNQTAQPFGGGLSNIAQPFGSTPQATSLGGGFGATTNTPFGTTNAFGSTGGSAFGGGFGAVANTTEGTGNPPFAPLIISETAKPGQPMQNLHVQVITAMKQYEHKSQEELRWEDFKKGVKGPGQGAGSGLAFGAASNPFGASSTPAFGGATASTNLFGSQPTMGGFGSTPTTGAFGQTTSAFGSSAATPAFGGFGSTATTGAFGQPATTSAFGQTGSTFGQQPATTSAFGQPASSNMFGQPATTSAFGQPAATNAFGQTGSTFGQPTTTTAFGQPASTGAFGQPATTSAFGQQSTSAFGQPATTSAFGQPATTNAFGQQPAATTSGFGGFGASSTLGGFGSPTGQSAFGTGATTQTPAFGGFGSTAAKPAVTFGGGVTGFGSPTAGAFGSTTGGFGGATTTPSFGGFGQTAAPTTTASGFGGFGGTTLGGTSGFGSTTGGFGSTAGQTSGFGTPSTGAFGAGSTQTSGFGGFSSPTAKPNAFGTITSGFGATPSLGGFGQASTTPSFGGFGSTMGAGLGGQTSTGFGGGFSTGSAFGATPTQPGAFGGFGLSQPQPQANQMTAFGQGTMGMGMQGGVGQTQQAMSQLSELQQKMDYLNRKKDELEIHLKDDKIALQSQLQYNASNVGRDASSKLIIAESPYRVPSTLISYHRHTPRSTAKITPRSYISSATDRGNTALVDKDDRPLSSSAIKLHLTKLTSSSSSSDVGATTSFLRPENLLGRSAKKLVIGPGFHKSTNMTPVALLTDGNATDMMASNQETTTPIRSILNQTSTMTPSSHLSDHLLSKSSTGITNTNGASQSNGASSQTHQDTSNQQKNVHFAGEQTGLTPLATRSPMDHHTAGSKSPANMTHTSNTFNEIRASLSNQKPDSTSSSATTNQDDDENNLGLGNIHNHTQHLINKTKSNIPEKEKPSPPVLTLTGYETIPSLQALQLLESREELMNIPNFTVLRPGYGSVEWIGVTDVNGLNLDKLIKIEKNTVMVYYDDDDEATVEENKNDESYVKDIEKVKPPVGQGLNKTAIITLLNVLPKEGTNVSKILQYEQKLRSACSKNGSEFIDYNPVTGKWLFKVQHFSKYGLVDDDDDDDNNNVNAQLPLPLVTKKVLTIAPSAVMMTDSSVPTGGAISPTTNLTKNIILPPKIKSSAKTLKLNASLLSCTKQQQLTVSNLLTRHYDQENILQHDNNNNVALASITPMINNREQSSHTYSTTPTGRGAMEQQLQYEKNIHQSIIHESISTPMSMSKNRQIQILNQSGNKRGAPSYSPATNTTTEKTLSSHSYSHSHSSQLSKSESKQFQEHYLKFKKSINIDEMFNKMIEDVKSKPSTCTQLMDTSPQGLAEAYKILREVKLKHFDLLGVQEIYPVYTNVHSTGGPVLSAQNKPIREFGLAMGRSFRVGWTPDGRIVHCGHSIYKKDTNMLLNVQQIKIEPSVPIVKSNLSSCNTTADDDEYINDIMSALLTQSKMQNVDKNKNEYIPMWSTPLANPDDKSEYKRFLTFLNLSKSVYDKQKINIDKDDKHMLTNDVDNEEDQDQDKTLTTNKKIEQTLIWIANKIIEFVDASIGQEKDYDSNKDTNSFMPFLEQKENINMGYPWPVHLWERRREAVSQWLQSLVSHQVPCVDNLVDAGTLGQCPQTYERIFELLSVRRVYEAVDVANAAGMFRLATLLSQADGNEDFVVLIRQQLSLWVENGADETIPDSLLKVYRMLSALPTSLGPLDKVYADSTLSGLGWARCIGVFFWYCKHSIHYEDLGLHGMSTSTTAAEGDKDQSTSRKFETIEPMASALMQYRLALQDQDVDFPCAPYHQPRGYDDDNNCDIDSDRYIVRHSPSQNPTHCLYNLLEIFYRYEPPLNNNEEESTSKTSLLQEDDTPVANYIIAALQSESSTKNVLDYRLSYLILVLLQSCGIISSTETVSSDTSMTVDSDDENSIQSYLPMCACIVRQHILSQLLHQKQYKWALFICLTIEDSFQRHYLIKDIVMRYCHVFCQEVIDNSNSNSSDLHMYDLIKVLSKMEDNTTISQDNFTTNKDNNVLNNIIKTFKEDVELCTNTFKIPISWFHESCAYYNGCLHKTAYQILHFNQAKLFQSSNPLLAQYIAPITLVEMNEWKNKHLLQILEIMNPKATIQDLINYNHDLTDFNSTGYVTGVNSIPQNNCPLSQNEILLHYLWIQRDVKMLQSKSTKNKNENNDIDISSNEQLELEQFEANLISRCHHLLQAISKTYVFMINEKQISSLVNTPRQRKPIPRNNNDMDTDVYIMACHYMSAYLIEILENFQSILVDLSLSSHSVFPLLFEPNNPIIHTKNVNYSDDITAPVNLSVKATVPVSNKIRWKSIQNECELIMNKSEKDVTKALLEAIMV